MQHDIGSFLRSRRDRIRPEDADLPVHGRRRVPGLRREELAQLASVSVDYYTRLEQGRSPNVSDAVLDAIARALRLTEAEHDHLRNLARSATGPALDADAEQVVHPGLQRLLDMADTVPAVVIGRRTDILACNALGAAVTGFGALPPAERNAVRFTFLHPDATDRYPDWESVASETVACLVRDAARRPGDPRLVSLVGELSIASARFRRLWARQDIADTPHGRKRINHPLVGELDFHYEILVLPDDPDQMLTTLTVEPGSATGERLAMLRDLMAAERSPAAA